MPPDRLTHTGFDALLERLAAAWGALDAVAAADCFTDDAVYMEPPDVQLFRGREELLAYFSPLVPGTYLTVHRVWFNEDSQSGVAEFTFGVEGKMSADHGVVVVDLADGKIASWREYPRKGPADFAHFTAADSKTWQWHIGNYP